MMTPKEATVSIIRLRHMLVYLVLCW